MSSYGSLCTEFYDLDKPQAPALAVSFYAQKARDAHGRVPEPMCGSGRFLVPLIQAGLIVDGTDSSPQMITACRRRLATEGLRADLYEQALEQMSLPHRYGLAFVPSGSIGLLTTDDALCAALSRIRIHLEPGAPLLIEFTELDDQADASSHLPIEPRVVTCMDGAVITYMSSAHRTNEPGTILFRGMYVKSMDGEVICSEDEDLMVRNFLPDRLCSMLRDCGFGNSRRYTSRDLPFLEGSGCVLIEVN